MFFSARSAGCGSPDWAFRQRGQSGLWVSELFPHLGEVADELTLIHSMVADTSNHTPATFQENSGFRLNGFPAMGAWLSYGLGSESDDLPAFVVIPDAREFPAGGSINWSNGFLPARHQGVVIRPQGEPIDDLFPSRPIAPGAESAARELVGRMNHRHLERHVGEDALAARIRGYEMAARMQTSVPLVTDLEREPPETLALYGVDRRETTDFGRACLIARRLLERGVRFVQLISGGTFGSPRRNWDGHEDMKANHGQEALRIDRPIAGLNSATCADGACSTTPWFCSRPSLAARRSPSRRPTSWAWGAIITSMGSPSGSPAPASSTESPTARPTRSAGRPETGS